MKKTVYEETVSQIKEVDRRIKCLNACFLVLSEPKMIDSVNYQLLALKTRRSFLSARAHELFAAQDLSEK